MKIKSYEEACEVLKITPPDVSHLPKDAQALTKLEIIYRALHDDNVYKANIFQNEDTVYYPEIYYSPDQKEMIGSASKPNYYYNVPMIYCMFIFKDPDLADYMAKQFFDIWLDYLSIKNSK